MQLPTLPANENRFAVRSTKFFLMFTLLFAMPVTRAAAAEVEGPLTKTFGIEMEVLTSHVPTSDVEQQALAHLGRSVPLVKIPTYHTSSEPPRLTGNNVLLIPDRHGRWASVNAVMRLMKRGDVDWVGIEMFAIEIQPEIQTFLASPVDSAEAQDSLRAIFHSTAIGWSNAWGGTNRLETDPYLEILRLAKSLGVRVFALENKEYRPFDHTGGRIDRLGLTVRNEHWVRRMPRSGRGIVFGGALHFLSTSNMNVQDFLVQRGQTDLLAYDFGLAKFVSAVHSETLVIKIPSGPRSVACEALWR